MKVEQVPDIPLFRMNTAAFIHLLPAQCLANVDGDSTYVRIQVLTNAGALDRDKQLAVVAQLTAIVAAAAGDPSLAGRTGSCSPKRRTADGAWPATPTPTRSWSRLPARSSPPAGPDRQLRNEPNRKEFACPRSRPTTAPVRHTGEGPSSGLPNKLVRAANGIDYAYRDTGPGASGGVPLVLLQHFRGNLDNWDPALIDALASARRVITFDNAGVGGSTGTTPGTVEQMARDAIAFIAAMDSARLISWGSPSAASSRSRSR